MPGKCRRCGAITEHTKTRIHEGKAQAWSTAMHPRSVRIFFSGVLSAGRNTQGAYPQGAITGPSDAVDVEKTFLPWLGVDPSYRAVGISVEPMPGFNLNESEPL